MGNILNLILGRTAPEHLHPKQIYQRRISDDPFYLRSILIFRAISERICYNRVTEKGRTDVCFQLWSILLCRAMSKHFLCKLIREKEIANYLVGILICGVSSDYIDREPFYETGLANDPSKRLPHDVLCMILSKLPLKEVVRTSAISRNWRYLWTVGPKLSFDRITMCGKKICGKQQVTEKFVDSVNAVLAQCDGRVIEELAIKFDFDTMLVDHLNTWVCFSLLSRTKLLALDLLPEDARGPDQYIFPFKLLDRESISCLQKIQLSFVCLRPPAQFKGFPNLRKLDLNFVDVDRKDLQYMLSNCRKLEWLSILRCHLQDKLMVNTPLPCLVYLSIVYCNLTEVAFNAAKLTTFEYRGRPVPIDLSKSSELQIAEIRFFKVTLEHTVTLLRNVLPVVQKLTFDTTCRPPEIPCLMNNPCKFLRLKIVKLTLICFYDLDTLSLVSFLRSAPMVEKLEVLYKVIGPVPAVQEPIRRLPERPFSSLKSLCITGFKGSNGQVEFLVHMVENAPALEVLTVEQSHKDQK